ncbi:dihydroorotase [Candidatus Parcubacteria bacterium]|nr:dihydroorotase [Candidatus Parcubacteria bacterium]
MMDVVLPCTLNQHAAGAVFMGNHPHPYETSTIEKTLAHRREIDSLIPEGSDFTPIMTLYLTDHISPDEVVRGFKEGVWRAAKLYMANQQGQGGTTGSQHGVRDLRGRYPVFAAMEKHQIPLLGHFEAVEEKVDEFDREIRSVNRDLKPLMKAFPGLPIVFEHITDGRAAEFVAEANHNIQATVTCHHLMHNRNVLFWEGLNPLKWAKPVFKKEPHRRKVRKYVTSGHKRFGAGTDSAPHDEVAKCRLCRCAAGIFTALSAVEFYAMVFDEDNALPHLEAFLSENFVGLYGMKPSEKKMTLVRQPRLLPLKVGDVWVEGGGTSLPWELLAA